MNTSFKQKDLSKPFSGPGDWPFPTRTLSSPVGVTNNSEDQIVNLPCTTNSAICHKHNDRTTGDKEILSGEELCLWGLSSVISFKTWSDKTYGRTFRAPLLFHILFTIKLPLLASYFYISNIYLPSNIHYWHNIFFICPTFIYHQPFTTDIIFLYTCNIYLPSRAIKYISYIVLKILITI
jgi:hypothetical protein